MAFPNDVLGTHVQLKIAGVWTDVTRYDSETKILQSQGIAIKRGQGGLQDKTPTGVAQWTWHDPNGVFNNENPRSPYYGLIPRNTPVRIYVPRTESALYLLDKDDGSGGYTVDKAALDITGDMEIRVDFEPKRFTRWANGQAHSQFLAGKYLTTGNQRSWYLTYSDPTDSTTASLRFAWTSAGTAATLNLATTTTELPFSTGRISVKVTFDVSNGGGVTEVRFYTSTTGIDGTYTQLGDAVTSSSSIPIFSSSANLEIGTINNQELDSVTVTNTENFTGRIYGFRLYNGIAGSLVADADYASETTGTTSFSDGLGNTWLLANSAEITNADYRFHGELSAPVIKAKKTIDGTGLDITIEAEAGGLIRRLDANDTPVESAIKRTFATYESNGWWPGEEPSGGDTPQYASAGTANGFQATISDITFAGFDADIAGSAGVMECGSTNPQFTGNCRSIDSTDECHFYAFFKFPSVPVAEVPLFSWYSNFEVARYTLTVSPNFYILRGYDFTGTQLFSNSVSHGSGGAPNQWMAYHSRTSGDGFGGVDITHEWHTVGTDLYFSGGVTNVAVSAIGHFNKVKLGGSALSGVKFCHPMTTNLVGGAFFSGTPSLSVVNYARAFAGEMADARFRRMCLLMGVESVVVGLPDDSEEMGPEPIDTVMNIVYQIPQVDGGKLSESRDQLALEYRTRKSIYNQPDLLSLTWSNLVEGLEATPDDTDTANDILAERDAGGEARATLQYGAMSTQAPPNGINPVPDSPSLNNYLLERLPNLAQAILLKRSWPEARYPRVPLNLHHPDFAANATQFRLAMNMDITDVLEITDLPNFLPPGALRLMVVGVSEAIYGQELMFDFATIPYGPFVSSELQESDTDEYYSDFKACHHTIAGVVQQQLNANITDSATSIAVKTLSGVLFKTGAVSYSIKIDGETLAVTNVSGSSSPQTLTVSRGTVGGYAAAHSENAYVYLVPTLKARL